MKYKDEIERMIFLYPSLFSCEEDAAHHLFFVNANGYAWIDGELVDLFRDETLSLEEEYEKLKREMNEFLARNEIDPDPYPAKAKPVRELYPLWRMSRICIFPDDAKTDWLRAGLKAINWARTVKRSAEDDHFLDVSEKRIKEFLRSRKEQGKL